MLWTGLVLTVIAAAVWGIFALVAHDNNMENRCERSHEGAERLYVKGKGHYCVYVYYKE